MLIYPAIDLLDGKCVRLIKGDFDQKTIYSEDPESLLRTFELAGAKALHLVDLSGAKDPAKRQLSLIRKLVSLTPMKIQSGGGVRTREDVVALLECGVDRVVVGSLAVSQPELVLSFLKEFGANRITLAMDVVFADGVFWIAVNGWKTITTTNILTLIEWYQKSVQLDRILCTDIHCDGMMAGPNFDLYQTCLAQFPTIDFQASGGITQNSDVVKLAKGGVKSAVIGKAIYEGTIDLEKILKDVQNAH